MARLTEQHLARVLLYAKAIDFHAPMVDAADFVTAALGLTLAEQGQYLAAADGAKNEMAVANRLSSTRDKMLAKQGRFPAFAVRVRTGQPTQIGGLGTALQTSGVKARTVARLAHREAIRNALHRIEQGHNLEAIAAAILAECTNQSRVTKGSGDQGVDALAWQSFLPLDPCCFPTVESETTQSPYPWEKITVVVSSKAHMGNTDDPERINPAFVRELVGSWIIQRTPVGKWNNLGILPLSPVQLVLATTYRLSSGAREECRSLGIQIWSLPELTFLLSEFAPNSVFPPDGQGGFDGHAFRAWWTAKAANRIGRANSVAAVTA